ncbi:FAD-dependent monooxygenase [Paenibacillus sp. N1-5-1-14]|uniref:FAD-dependent oxidoreductase n=1 Tax=Paenibacillus radicibacter TaxID=2972488 RepID=UPI0021596C45|nr:FAD-dependent oxidoreductase [Paenibacillus radicibacter]MCR8641233.1 FAD-dependent monooxygenase [Paenibacillus radicibacter]
MANRVVIIGSGIAGLSAAIGLQAQGIEVKLFEKGKGPRTAGVGVNLAPNALWALDRLGIGHLVRQVGKAFNEFIIYSDNGKQISSQPFDFLPDSMYAVHRLDLLRILHDQVKPGTIQYGMEYTSFEQNENGVSVSFADGTQVHADYALFADGAGSDCRTKLRPSAPLRVAKYTCWQGVTSADEPFDNRYLLSETMGPKGRFGICPLANGQIYWYACINGTYNEEQIAKFGVQDLLEHFGEFHAPIPEVIRKTMPQDMVHNDIFDLPAKHKFAFNRILLLGDAAHPITPNLGQGACQALEDAAVLMHLIKCYSDMTLEEVFVLFEKKRLMKIKLLTQIAWSIGNVSQWSNPLFCTLRNLGMQYSPPFLYKQQFKYMSEVR